MSLTGVLEPIPIHGFLSLVGLDIIIYRLYNKKKTKKNHK